MIQKAMIQAVAPVLALGLTAAPAGAQEFALNYGVAVTSNYIANGTTQSNDNPALQGYVEGSSACSTAGSGSRPSTFPTTPTSAATRSSSTSMPGIRPSFGDPSLDRQLLPLSLRRQRRLLRRVRADRAVSRRGFRRGRRGVRLRSGRRHSLGRAGRRALTFAEVWEVGGAVGIPTSAARSGARTTRSPGTPASPAASATSPRSTCGATIRTTIRARRCCRSSSTSEGFAQAQSGRRPVQEEARRPSRSVRAPSQAAATEVRAIASCTVVSTRDIIAN